MWFSRKRVDPVQRNLDELLATLERRIAILERSEKALQAEADEWIAKYRTLYARTCKAAERVERHAAPEAPGPTIVPQDGVTPPPQREDPWVALSVAKRARRGA